MGKFEDAAKAIREGKTTPERAVSAFLAEAANPVEKELTSAGIKIAKPLAAELEDYGLKIDKGIGGGGPYLFPYAEHGNKGYVVLSLTFSMESINAFAAAHKLNASGVKAKLNSLFWNTGVAMSHLFKGGIAVNHSQNPYELDISVAVREPKWAEAAKMPGEPVKVKGVPPKLYESVAAP